MPSVPNATCALSPSCNTCSSIFRKTMGAHINAIQEFTDIFVLTEARLTDQSSRARHQVNVGPRHNQLILHGCTFLDGHARQKVHSAHDFLSQIIPHLHGLATSHNVCPC